MTPEQAGDMTPEQAAAHLFRRLSGVDAQALDVLVGLIVKLKRLQTLGGPPPPFNDQAWKNKTLPGGVHPDYAGRL